MHRHHAARALQLHLICTAIPSRRKGTAIAPHLHRHPITPQEHCNCTSSAPPSHHAARALQLLLMCTAITPQGHRNCTAIPSRHKGTAIAPHLHRHPITPQGHCNCSSCAPPSRRKGTATAPHLHRHPITPQGHCNCTSSAPQPSGTRVVNRGSDLKISRTLSAVRVIFLACDSSFSPEAS